MEDYLKLFGGIAVGVTALWKRLSMTSSEIMVAVKKHFAEAWSETVKPELDQIRLVGEMNVKAISEMKDRQIAMLTRLVDISENIARLSDQVDSMKSGTPSRQWVQPTTLVQGDEQSKEPGSKQKRKN